MALKQKNSGTDFEKVVADIQAQVDPSASVLHNQQIVDRLGHSRQFDVVIRGRFAGQDILGVIECKDLGKKVGTPEIDAFVTKSQDINANFKIVVSKKGFSKPAIQKAKHYGVQTLSLMPSDGNNQGFKVGNYWFADLYYWDQLSLTLHFVNEPEKPIIFNPYNVTINNKKVIDAFINNLIENHSFEDRIGWIGISVDFFNYQVVNITEEEFFLCKGMQFQVKRSLAKKRKFVGMNGAGFFDWQQSKVTVPPLTNLMSDSVSTDLMSWEDRDTDDNNSSDSINIKIIAHVIQFEAIENAIDLESL